MSEGEWQKDQGDDCHQVYRIGAETCFSLHKVGRIGAETCFGLHRVRINKLRELFWPSFYSSGKRKRFVGNFEGASPPLTDFLFFP